MKGWEGPDWDRPEHEPERRPSPPPTAPPPVWVDPVRRPGLLHRGDRLLDGRDVDTVEEGPTVTAVRCADGTTSLFANRVLVRLWALPTHLGEAHGVILTPETPAEQAHLHGALHHPLLADHPHQEPQ